MSCDVCHTAFPQLTPFGRNFKLEGYTFSSESTERWHPPLGAMVQSSVTILNKNDGILEDGIAPFDDAERSAADKINLIQQASAFYGGRITDRIGAFVQLTYDGAANDIALDNTDIRYAGTATVADRKLVYGFTINNNPAVEDLWNTTPAWGYPFASSAVAPAPAAAALIDGGLAQQVGGIGAYAFWSDLIYGAVSIYRTTDDGIARPLGAGTTPESVTHGDVPYWRIALYRQWDRHSASLGAYGLQADIYPEGGDSGPTDQYTDYAFDAQYQYIDSPHMLTVRGTWIHEEQDWDASHPAGNTSNSSDILKTWKINTGYYYRHHYGIMGGSLGYFSTTGDSDSLLYAPEAVSGSRTGNPESKGFILQASYILKDNYKFGLQYTIYDKFNGAGSNYDGDGRDASDNNTLYLFSWLMF